jgi:hypothetical protein
MVRLKEVIIIHFILDGSAGCSFPQQVVLEARQRLSPSPRFQPGLPPLNNPASTTAERNQKESKVRIGPAWLINTKADRIVRVPEKCELRT